MCWTLQELRGAGLISLKGSTLKVLDWDGLKKAGDFDEHQGLTCPPLDVVQANPVHVQKAANRRMLALGVSRRLGRIGGGRAQGCGRANQRRSEPAMMTL